ncbi:cyclin-dependent kinase D-3 [Trifolium repens]|nr:cyclin-dependent kinase D-3 [Trifolium repens]
MSPETTFLQLFNPLNTLTATLASNLSSLLVKVFISESISSIKICISPGAECKPKQPNTFSLFNDFNISSSLEATSLSLSFSKGNLFRAYVLPDTICLTLSTTPKAPSPPYPNET